MNRGIKFIYFSSLMLIVLVVAGCTHLTDVATTPTPLLDPDFYRSEPSKASQSRFERAREAPEEEWEILSVTEWKQDKHDKRRNEEHREIRRRHTPTGITETVFERRSKAQEKVTTGESR